MAKPTSAGSRAQHSRARRPQHSDDGDEPELAATLAAELRAFYALHSELAPCLLSTPELAALFVPHVYARKPENAERQIQRANRLIRGTYGSRFREQLRTYGRAMLPVARWITKPGGDGRSDPSDLTCEVDLRIGDLEQRAEADRARGARRRSDSAFRSNRSQPRSERAREGGGSPAPRRRAVPHGVRNPPELEVAPVSLAGLAALRRRHALAFDELAKELRRKRYHEHVVEACRAVRTLAERDADEPLALLRHFMNRALAGDLLCDDDAEAVARAEQDARKPYAYDPTDPATHWRDLDDGSPRAPPDPTPDELEARRWAAIRRAREAELRAPAGVGWWQMLAKIASTGRFLANLKPETVAELLPKK